MDFSSNIAAFVIAAKKSNDPITKAYFGLVAIELTLKNSVPLKDHNVPAALDKFAHKFAIQNLAGCKIRLNTLAAQLKNDFSGIHVQGKDKQAQPTPAASYPNIRYTRLEDDDWPTPFTSAAQAETLANTVAAIQNYLKTKFNKCL